MLLHYGEGEYLDTELAIQECVGEEMEPLAPLRPEDEPGALLEPQTADIALPADRERLELVRDWDDGEDWIEAADAGAAASFTFRAGAAYAVLSGGGVEPGLYEVDGRVEAESPGTPPARRAVHAAATALTSTVATTARRRAPSGSPSAA